MVPVAPGSNVWRPRTNAEWCEYTRELREEVEDLRILFGENWRGQTDLVHDMTTAESPAAAGSKDASTDDGGPAFPRTYEFVEDGEKMDSTMNGMSLRDWFAGQALAGQLADYQTNGAAEQFAECSYKHADAMLAARKQKGASPCRTSSTKSGSESNGGAK